MSDGIGPLILDLCAQGTSQRNPALSCWQLPAGLGFGCKPYAMPAVELTGEEGANEKTLEVADTALHGVSMFHTACSHTG